MVKRKAFTRFSCSSILTFIILCYLMLAALIPRAYSQPSGTSKMELLAKFFNG